MQTFETFDYSNKEMFTLRAALLWTISDFPGWNTHNFLACPTCNFDTNSCWLYRGKFCLWDTVIFYIRSTNSYRIVLFSMEEMS